MSASDSHGHDAKGHDSHGHDAKGHDSHGHDAGGLPPYEMSARFGIGAAGFMAVMAIVVQASLGSQGRAPSAESEGEEPAAKVERPAPVLGPADLILTNAHVVAPGYEGATTVVIGTVRTRDGVVHPGKILDVGSDELLIRKGPETRVKDVKGAFVIPGLRDAHGHLLDLGRKLNGRECDLTGATSLEDVKERFATWVKIKHPKPGDWLVGHGWDESLFEEFEAPNADLIAKAKAAYAAGNKVEGERLEKAMASQTPLRVGGKVPDSTELLDDVALDNPVILYRTDGHMAWVNHKALELAKISHESFDPPDGKVLRDAKGEPTGILVDGAIGLVATLEPAEKPEEIEQDLFAACQACAKAGLVEVHDAGVDRPTENALRRLAIERRLPIRVYAMIARDTKDLFERLGHKPAHETIGFLTTRAVKLWADGALGSHGALLLEPYSDQHDTSGVRRLKVEEIEKVAHVCLERGFQLCVHAIGDRAIRDVLDVFEKVFAEAPAKAKDARFRVEHAQVISPKDLARFAKLGVIASMQPRHATTDMRWALERLGAERLEGAYAWKTLIKSGAHVPFGSDFPVEPYAPLLGLYAAVTRQDETGSPSGGWRPEEKLSPAQALKAFTEEPAYASFAEGERGRILPGQDADLTLLSKDPLDVLKHEPRKLLETRVLGVVVGGIEPAAR